MKRVWRSGVLGVFSELDTTLAAIERLQELNFRDLRAISPVPRHELLEAVNPGVSPIRYYALFGALAGMLTGLALTIVTGLNLTHLAYRVSGKPVIAWPPFLIISFELTILFGALSTVLGFMIHAWLPRRTIRRSYQPAFSDDKFGVFVPCEQNQWQEVGEILKQAGAEEVQIEAG